MSVPMPILMLKGFDPDSNESSLGLSVNTAVLLPPDGDAAIVSPPSDAYQEQLRCLQTLEEQISTLGVSTLAKQNITNTAAESKRLDRIDSDSIMSIISEDLARAVGDILRIAGKYAGKEPPEVTIPHDFENRLPGWQPNHRHVAAPDAKSDLARDAAAHPAGR